MRRVYRSTLLPVFTIMLVLSSLAASVGAQRPERELTPAVRIAAPATASGSGTHPRATGPSQRGGTPTAAGYGHCGVDSPFWVIGQGPMVAGMGRGVKREEATPRTISAGEGRRVIMGRAA